MSSTSLQDHPKLVDQMVDSNMTNDLPSGVPNDWAECLFRFGKDCTKPRRKERPMMEHIFNALEKIQQNPDSRHWMAKLPVKGRSDSIVSSFKNIPQGKVMLEDCIKQLLLDVFTFLHRYYQKCYFYF